ncbi:MAG: thioredoxin family protein [Carboxylicivirga sp.]|jgi:thioredoxin-related protein|nr:thioredoxin family protein [Carboxylicivirga sp.]
MRKLIIGFLWLISASVYCQIDFVDLSYNKNRFKSLLQESEKENKLIFIYFTSKGCGPCKSFEKKVFTDTTVINLFVNNFINAKVNWENKQPFLNKKYLINGFPQFVFVDHKGKVVHHMRYYMEKEEFLQVGEQALSENDNFIAWKSQIENDNYSYEVVSKYLRAIERPRSFMDSDFKCESQNILDKYFATQDRSTWIEACNWLLIKNFVANPHSEQFEYLISQYEQFTDRYGKIEIDQYIFNVWSAYTSGCTTCSDRFKLANEEILKIDFPPIRAVWERKPAMEIYDEIYKEQRKTKEECNHSKLDSLRLEFYRKINKPLKEHYYLYSAYQINDWTRNVYQYAKENDDKAVLIDCCVWMEKLSEITRYFEVFDTYSHILSALGENDKALEMQKCALVFAQRSKESDRIIQRINKRINVLQEHE